MTFEEVYQQIRKMHYEILDERESISKSARLSLSTWMLDILTEYRMAIEALEREPSDDLISRAEAIEAIENTDWYHQNRNKDMVSGANSDEHQAWYKADDVYTAFEAVPSADRPRGEWIHTPNGIDRDFVWWTCSECGHKIFSETIKDRIEFHAYCGRCGADMKGENK